jgi:hypothetical protein
MQKAAGLFFSLSLVSSPPAIATEPQHPAFTSANTGVVALFNGDQFTGSAVVINQQHPDGGHIVVSATHVVAKALLRNTEKPLTFTAKNEQGELVGTLQLLSFDSDVLQEYKNNNGKLTSWGDDVAVLRLTPARYAQVNTWNLPHLVPDKQTTTLYMRGFSRSVPTASHTVDVEKKFDGHFYIHNTVGGTISYGHSGGAVFDAQGALLANVVGIHNSPAPCMNKVINRASRRVWPYGVNVPEGLLNSIPLSQTHITWLRDMGGEDCTTVFDQTAGVTKTKGEVVDVNPKYVITNSPTAIQKQVEFAKKLSANQPPQDLPKPHLTPPDLFCLAPPAFIEDKSVFTLEDIVR